MSMPTEAALETSVDVVELQSLKNRVVEIRQQIADLQTELNEKELQLQDMGRRFVRELGLEFNSTTPTKDRAPAKKKAPATAKASGKKKGNGASK